MKFSLERIEARLQAVIEGSAAFLFPFLQKHNDLPGRIVEIVQNSIQTSSSGQRFAPNQITLRIHPQQAVYFENNPAVISELMRILRETATQAQAHFPGPPSIQILASEEIAPGKFELLATSSLLDLPQTSDMPPIVEEDITSIPPGAFLIVDGTRVYPLSEPVVNIGRRPDNQLVVEDARVSRLHAQLRAVRSRYIVFDLNSRGGTSVNGEQIHQKLLLPGDVISLAGVPLIYGQDSISLDETQNITPPQVRI